MKDIFFFIIVLSFPMVTSAQYEPGAVNYGVVGIKNFGSINEAGLGVRLEYASNCYTTFLGEYNRLLSISTDENLSGYNELAFGVNLILFNWYPTTITAGLGYMGNDSPIFQEIEEEAFLSFITGDFNHGIQVKLRALHQISVPIHIFAEFNVKSLGRRYDTFLIGFSYDFEAR